MADAHKKVRVLVFGTFDGLHPGHKHFFQQAKAYGDELCVVVSRDDTVLQVKGKKPKYTERKRLAVLQKIPMVHEAVLGNPGSKYDIIEELKPDVICLGYDQQAFTAELKPELKRRNMEKIRVMRLEPFEEHIYKSSKLNK
ncbi:FAD synthase [Candidatus Woesearchaeota archaeon]|nr:FAD synthase [Candidatus Woesearchaeota archaeon]